MHASTRHHQNPEAPLAIEDVPIADIMHQLKVAQDINASVRKLLYNDSGNDAAPMVLEKIRGIAGMETLALFEKQTGREEEIYFEWRYPTGSDHGAEGEWAAYRPAREVILKLAEGKPARVDAQLIRADGDSAASPSDTQNGLIFPIQVFGEWWGGLCLDCGTADVGGDTPLFGAFATTADLLGIFFERQIATRENVESDKLAGALEMAGTVCHKLNQPMQVILGYASMVTSGDISEPAQVCEIVKMIEDETRRMGIITKNLMGITKYRSVETPEVGSMCDIDGQSAIS